MKYIKGDLIDLANNNEFDIIVQGCNCFNTMGAGIAKQIAHWFPNAQEVDNRTMPGDMSKLGTISVGRGGFNNRLYVVNAYTQYGTASEKGECVVSYPAVQYAMKEVRTLADIVGTEVRIGIPMIGAGLAGGDWNIIEDIINRTFERYDVTCVQYEE